MLIVLATLAGMFIAVQAAINSQLGRLLASPLTATLVAFVVSASCVLLVIVANQTALPSYKQFIQVPPVYWLGGILSAAGVSLFYFLIPQMGVAKMMIFALLGQLISALIISHFGWFNLPQIPLTSSKIMGAAALITGVILINK